MAGKRQYRRNEDLINHRKMIRMRFRNLIRSAALNRIWLLDVGDQKLSLNVKKNINMLVRTRRKIGLLTMAEKSLIRAHYSTRTTEERKTLVTLIGGLTCFARISPKIRARLCNVIKFMVIGPGRTLIREGDPPSVVYFILTGEVEVRKKFFDHITGKWLNKVQMLVGPGECIGDVELIEGCLRTQTLITTNDFNAILRNEMTRQWKDRKAALMGLDYFKAFTNEQLHKVDLKTIEAKCKIVRSPIKLTSSTSSSYESWSEISENEEYYDMQNENEEEDTEYEYEEIHRKKSRKSSKLKKKQSRSHRFISTFDGIERQEVDEEGENEHEFTSMTSHSIEGSTGPTSIITIPVTSDEAQQQQFKEMALQQQHHHHYRRKKEKTRESDTEEIVTHDQMKTSFAHITGIETPLESDDSEPYWIPYQKPITVRENHFIDVGTLTFGGIFGLGEKSEHRVIMARTTVQCLLIPRFWLFEKEQCPGNIWQRRQFYLNSTIPSRDTLFKDFLTTLQWQKFKQSVLHEYVGPNLLSNPTQPEDVPIISRIVETSDE
uniref:Cyclic nucleotide-binding domain-containing protein n=1 Tax=Glossina brevipalpis TaxID=37001 RepID=A0A1A9WPT1_9MUSC